MAQVANGATDNPFESVLRAISLDVRGLALQPQVLIRTERSWARPDLVDEARRLVVEADSFAWHGGRKDLMRDCRRYNDLVLDGWRVLRFTWEDVMLHPLHVTDCLRAAVGVVDGRAEPRRSARRST